MMAQARRSCFPFSCCGVFKKKEKTCTPCFYQVTETLVKVWENMKKRLKHSPGTLLQLVFPQHFSFPQTSTRVSITRKKHSTCFVFLKYRLIFQNVMVCESIDGVATFTGFSYKKMSGHFARTKLSGSNKR